jgi:hypothetical protein
MKNIRPVAVLAAGLMAATVLAGCQRSVSGLDTRGSAEALPPAPIGVVQATPLEPAPMSPDQQVAAIDPALQTPTVETPAAVAPPPVSTAPVTREGMAGTWTVATDNPECRIILAFTKWSGGYRAATRRCNTPEIGAVTAWDVKDNKVVLVDANGNQVASLASTGAESYDGATAAGTPVRFSR